MADEERLDEQELEERRERLERFARVVVRPLRTCEPLSEGGESVELWCALDRLRPLADFMAASMVSAKIFCWALVNGALSWSPLSVLSLLLPPLLLLESWWDVGLSSESESLSELELELLELVGPDWACR